MARKTAAGLFELLPGAEEAPPAPPAAVVVALSLRVIVSNSTVERNLIDCFFTQMLVSDYSLVNKTRHDFEKPTFLTLRFLRLHDDSSEEEVELMNDFSWALRIFCSISLFISKAM